FDENQNDVSHIIWAMVGSPAKIGFYSKNTRNLEMMNNKEITDEIEIVDEIEEEEYK
ncbi:23291_t:CDS:2, partial [Entrophospora sp. SA101]